MKSLLKGKNPRLFGAVAVLLIAGALLVWWTVSRADREMRADLLRQARLVAQAVNVERVKALTGTEADLAAPEYLRLKEQLAAVRSAYPQCRFLYLVGRRADGALFFFLDSEPAGSRDYSPPGQLYEEAPQGFRRVFAAHTDLAEGPFTDRWGIWVSSLVPIHGPRTADKGTGAILAVLGMDIDARAWNRMLARAALPPALLTLALAALLVTGSSLLAWRSRLPLPPPHWMRRIEPALAVAVGLVLTLFAAWLLHERETHDRNEAFAQLAASRTEAIADTLRALRSTGMESLAHFYENSATVTPEEFRRFTSYLAKNRMVQAWEWIPVAPAADKSRFEAAARAAGLKGFVIWQKDAQGKRTPAIGRDVYYPVFQAAPLAGNEQTLGYDLGSEPLRRKALEEATRTGLPTATDPITLVRETVSQKGLLIFRPVFGNGEPRRLRGFATAALRMGDLLGSTAPDNPALMEISLLRKDAAPESLAASWNADTPPCTGLFSTRPVFAFGKVLALNVHAGPGFMRLHPARAGWLAALTGLLLTAAIAVMISVILRGREELERLVSERTDALRESEERLAATLRSIGDGVIATDIAGRVTDLNSVAEILTGWTTAEAMGQPVCEVFRILNAETRQGAEIPVGRALREDRMIGLDDGTSLIARDGAELRIADSCAPIHDAAGAVIGAVLVFRDVTEEYRSREELRESESRLLAITESAQDAILMMDPEGRVSYWNPAAERILGYTGAEAIGRNLHALITPPRFHEAHRAAFPGFLRTGQGAAVGKTLDLEARRKDGVVIVVQLSLSAIRIKGGWYAVGLLRDITKQKGAEEDLRESNRHLEMATARANALAEQAELANLAKSEFLANMSHEIRTPMNGVIGMTGLLLDTELSDEQRRYAETVRSSGESLLGLINDILDFSKIEAGKLEMETLDFDLRVLLDDFAATLAVRAHEKGLELICAAAPDVPAFLRGDPGRLRQILTNLTGNAVKFTHQGEIAVRASLVSETGAEAVLRFSIKDTGIGIPVEKQEMMFQKFTQADTSTTRRYGGTGLGLAISKELAERMGGEIGVISPSTSLRAGEEGAGSEFWFTVRLGKQPEPELNVTPPADIRGVHVLVVDDNATNREVLMAQFAAWGLWAEAVPDGPAALRELYRARDAGGPFRIAILDMQMPGMDGAALARAIKADETIKDTRLVLLSSLGQRGDARKMEEIGFAAYLTKPARQSELFGCLSAVLAGTSEAQPARTIVTRHTVRELRRGGARILLAEDNITNQQVALGILRKLGLSADAVANGAEALKALETIPYDLVLMDVQMPEMDGIEATRQIRDPRSAISNHGIPVIAMTAHAMQGDRERCIEAGMNDYVTKPVDPQALAEALEKWLPKEKAPGTPEVTASVSAREPEAPVFDRRGMMARLMDDEDLARTLAGCFLEDIPRQIEALRGCLEAGDAPGAERQAHSIKGASANMGGERLREVAFEMEKAGKAGDLEVVMASMAALDMQFDTLKEAMTKEL